MQEIGAFEAKNTLGSLLDRVERGEESIITRHGRPVARLVPYTGANRNAWGTTMQLARRHRLTLYDAAYLELAKRCGLPLATLDRELRTAGEAERVEVLG